MNGSLSTDIVKWSNDVALGVVMAAGGYPIKYESGQKISGLNKVDSENIKIFHAGTTTKNKDIVTNGGRVLCVVGKGKSTYDAHIIAYSMVNKIEWQDEYHRDDIGYRAISRERE
jgi:phosphoribosylamine--glycine ligase